ncbi:MAG: hypothetical protein AB7P04_04325 [Bacteriovoracia bacterium]
MRRFFPILAAVSFFLNGLASWSSACEVAHSAAPSVSTCHAAETSAGDTLSAASECDQSAPCRCDNCPRCHASPTLNPRQVKPLIMPAVLESLPPVAPAFPSDPRDALPYRPPIA